MPERLPSLTGIRGIAALWVVFFHMIQMSWAFDLPLRLPGHILAMSGWAGVDLFFILSGFMLMHVHASQFERLSWPVCKDFGVSRFFRVWPLNAAALGAMLALVLLDPDFAQWYSVKHPGGLSVEGFFATLALATIWYPNPGHWNGPVWSLSAEVIGYLFFPLLAWLSHRVRSFALCIALAAACIAGVLLQQYFSGTLGGNNTDSIAAVGRMAGYFSCGVLLKRAALIRPSLYGLQSLAVVSVGAILALLWVPGGDPFMPIGFASLIYALSDQRGPVAWLLSTRIALFLGAISFPLYLLHDMPLLAYHFHVARGDLPGWLYNPGLLLFLVIACAIAWLAHRWIEQPSHRFARRRIRESQKASPTTSLPAN